LSAAARVAVVDLGLGNLYSVARGLERAGAAPEVVAEARALTGASHVVLPGVGSFADGARRAAALGLKAALADAIAGGARVLGICLGMQLLFDEGDEDGPSGGLGLLRGRAVKLPASAQVPHIGWERLNVERPSPLLREGSPWCYFAHSYYVEAGDPQDVAASVAHGVRVPAIVALGRIFGVQFHPEKSARDGEALLRRFLAA
jgi:glutamine amidotransferase